MIAEESPTKEIIEEKPTVQSILPYKDLDTHWIKKIANQLKLEKLDNNEQFFPKKEISRSEFSKYVVKINNLKNNNPEKLSFNDINSSDENYEFINTVVSNKLLTVFLKQNLDQIIK